MRVLGQGVFDLFCRDMDDHLREAGVSDLKVPKEMREMGEAFYGRRSAYRAALAEPGDDALEAALMRNVYSRSPKPAPARGAACGLCPAASQGLARESRLDDVTTRAGPIRTPSPTEMQARERG